jgi:hypothetical protein
MSVSAPPAPTGPVATPRAAPIAQPSTSHFPDLHSLAVDIVTDLQALATGLHQSGASPQAVQVIVNMTNAVHGVAQHLAQLPPIPNPAHGGGQQAPQSGQPGVPAGAGQPAPAPQQGPPQQGGGNPHKQLGVAIGNLLQASHDAANQQGPQQP